MRFSLSLLVCSLVAAPLAASAKTPIKVSVECKANKKAHTLNIKGLSVSGMRNNDRAFADAKISGSVALIEVFSSGKLVGKATNLKVTGYQGMSAKGEYYTVNVPVPKVGNVEVNVTPMGAVELSSGLSSKPGFTPNAYSATCAAK
jgi:hypothetical protein